jgi:beta-N-acetylhexosaminidase
MKRNGTLIIGLPGTSLSHQDKTWITHPDVAGIILFKHNIESKSQIQEYCDAIRQLRQDIFICVDQEGGRVQRFKDGFTLIPPMGTLGKLYHQDPSAAKDQSRIYGEIIAKELQEIGVDFSFAPVLDLDYGISSIIGDRAFNADPHVVSELASSFIDGFHVFGMTTCGKHFPGHGYVAPDSHIADPVDDRPLNIILKTDIVPYIKLNNKLDAIMTSHILFPQVDNEIVSYSSRWLKDILRNDLGYTGLIISDDLVMHAAAKLPPIERVHKALNAGCDMVLYCQDYEGIAQILAS